MSDLPEYYSYDELPEFHKWVLCTAEFKKMDGAMGHNAEPFSIEILVNGKDVGLDFIRLLSEVEGQIDTMVNNEAKDLLDEKFADVISKLDDVRENINDIIFD